MAKRELLDLIVRRKGRIVVEVSAEADPANGVELRQLLEDAVRRDGRDKREIGDYEMDVRYAGERALLRTFVAAAS